MKLQRTRDALCFARVDLPDFTVLAPYRDPLCAAKAEARAQEAAARYVQAQERAQETRP